MFTPAQAKSAIAVNPYRRAEELEAFIDSELRAACARENPNTAWPLVIVPRGGYGDVIEEVVARYTAAGWGMTLRPAGQGGQLLVDRPT